MNIDPEVEIEKNRKEELNRQLTTKLDRIEQGIPELEKRLRESILTSRNSLIDELKRLEDLADRLRIEISKPLQQPVFDPEIFEVFKKFSSAVSKGDDNRLLVHFMYNWNPDFFKVKYKSLYDKYIDDS